MLANGLVKPVHGWLGAGSATAALAVAALIALAPIVTYARGETSAPDGDSGRDRPSPASNLRNLVISFPINRDNPDRLLKIAADVGGGALADMEALIQARPAGPFTETTVNYIEQRLRRAENYAAQSLRQLPTMPNAHIAMADLIINRCIAGGLIGRTGQECVLDALPELWAAVRGESYERQHSCHCCPHSDESMAMVGRTALV